MSDRQIIHYKEGIEAKIETLLVVFLNKQKNETLQIIITLGNKKHVIHFDILIAFPLFSIMHGKWKFPNIKQPIKIFSDVHTV